MTTQKNVDRLIKMVGAATQELTIVQSAMEQMVKFLIEEKDAQGKNALGVTELTIFEKAKLLEEQICPDCGSKTFYSGPEGGCSTNIKCVKCGSKFNVFPPHFAERI